MGMDVYGKNPTMEKLNDKGKPIGEYFRNNVWWWRPLWQYCYTSSPELIDKETFLSGCHNDGAGLNATDAIKLGVKLLVLIEDGSCAEYKKGRDEWLETLKDENCSVCNNNNRGYKKKKECKPCDGKGTKDNWNKHYPFHVENVKEFADFLIVSGGFKIC